MVVIEDNIRYSGHETKGMKRLKCSLLLPEHSKTEGVGWRALDPNPRLVITGDRGFNVPDRTIRFEGASLCCIAVKAADETTCEQPGKIFALAGKCRYTKACQKEFKIQMRTKKDKKKHKYGSQFDWPGFEGFECCPVCAAQCPPTKGKQKHYWMVLSMLHQEAINSTYAKTYVVAARLELQLMCCDCLDQLVDGHIFGTDTESPNVADTLRMIPGFPVMVGADPELRRNHPDAKRVVTAWALYSKFEQMGLYHAFQMHYEDLARASGIFHQTRDIRTDYAVADANTKTCLVCSKELLQGAALQCSRCKTATYCSRECQCKDWKRHKLVDCVDRVREDIHSLRI